MMTTEEWNDMTAGEPRAVPHPLAALIAGVPRYSLINSPCGPYMGRVPSGGWLYRDDVLAALKSATPPDLVEAERCVKRLRKTEEAGHVHHMSKADRLATADTITAIIALCQSQAAQIAGLANGAGAASQMALDYIAKLEAAEAEAATLRAEVERLRGALDQIAWSNDSKWQADCARAALEGKA